MSNFNSNMGLNHVITSYSRSIKSELAGLAQSESTDFAHILGRETGMIRRNDDLHRVESTGHRKPESPERNELRNDSVERARSRVNDTEKSRMEAQEKKSAENDQAQQVKQSRADNDRRENDKPDAEHESARDNRTDATAGASSPKRDAASEDRSESAVTDAGEETSLEGKNTDFVVPVESEGTRVSPGGAAASAIQTGLPADSDPDSVESVTGLELSGLAGDGDSNATFQQASGDVELAGQIAGSDGAVQTIGGGEIESGQAGELSGIHSDGAGEPLAAVTGTMGLNQIGEQGIEGAPGVDGGGEGQAGEQVYSGRLTETEGLGKLSPVAGGSEVEEVNHGVGTTAATIRQSAVTASANTESSLSKSAGDAMRQTMVDPVPGGQNGGSGSSLSDDGAGQSGQQRSSLSQGMQVFPGMQNQAASQKNIPGGDAFENVMNGLENKGIKVAQMSAEQRPQGSLHAKDFSVLKNYTTSLPTPMNQEEWSDEFVEKVKWLTSRQFRSAEIHVRPAELGPIEIKISVQNDQTSIVFNSQHASVRDLLELNVHRLRDMLDASGVNLADVDVSDQSAKNSSGSDDEAQDSAGQSERGTGDSAENGEVSNTELTVAPEGLVDTFV
ncbi:MAG: hypothetical protein CSA52_03545 [Gammaproteobacteria bacterium]|nr:MAG: hypothetical protein CSB48_05950 [Pseudomonadota bacterium]PIE38101.1 MAG: hypothetical protein CSA52_03545 [Gammaproteobacteria bacterium]